MKKEAWPVEYMIRHIDIYLNELPTKEGFFYKTKYKQFKAGDAKPAKILEETEKWKMTESRSAPVSALQ